MHIDTIGTAERRWAYFDRQHALRLGLGPASVLVLGQIANWPLSFLGAVLAALILQSKTPLPVSAGLRLVAIASLQLAASWAVFNLLYPFPVAYLAVMAIGIVLCFRWSIAGGSPVGVILALLSVLLVPNTVQVSPLLAAKVAVWLPLNMFVAVLASGLAWLLFPGAPWVSARAAAPTKTDFDPVRRIWRMSLVTVPFAIVFLLLESGALIVLILTALLTTQLAESTQAGPTVAKTMLYANLLGGLAAVAASEVTVLAPTVATMALASLLMCGIFALLFAGDGHLSSIAGSALTTAIIIYGGAMGPFSGEADVKVIVRLLQIAFALAYLLAAFIVVDAWLPERAASQGKPGEPRQIHGLGLRSRRKRTHAKHGR